MQALHLRTPRLAVHSNRCPRRYLPLCRLASGRSEVVVQELRAVRVSVPNDETGGRLEADVLVEPGSRVLTVSIKKPLGLVLAERSGRILVESVTGGGHAAAAGVAAGDVLLATSARAQAGSAGRGGGATVPVLLPAAGEAFATVAAAIRSNTCSQCRVHLVLERREGEPQAADG